jgi:gliding motility-associated-like protein
MPRLVLSKGLVLQALFLFFSCQLFGQGVVSIADGTASLCSGILYDTGGQGGTGYQNNENFTLVLCPSVPGDVITLQWLNFALSTTNTANPPGNNADNLTIYDGNNTGAPTLGTYSGTQLQGLLVSCTSLNTTGCITLVWNSNSAGTGVFAATITCSTPCQRPTVAMAAPTVAQNPQKICDGETINFDGSTSYAAPGFNIVDYIWNWGDGQVDTMVNGITSHTFNSGAGEYLVNLYVIDDNGCISTNVETIKVLVGTIPNFIGTSSDTSLCLGESVCLDGEVTPLLWTGLPISSLGGATYLPDDVGQCFTATLDFQGFLPGQTLTNIADLLDICVSMEHSYMGDLVATIYCPNGQSVITHQQNGGGTYLGDPFQANDSLLPGDCWQYCWAPTATNGTWVDNSQFGATPNVVPVTNSGGNSLVPGTYESLNPMTSLVGCPLNGTWTIEFCDLWGADDGFVCDWTANFDPSLYPSITTFEPVIGNQCDSSYWIPIGAAAGNALVSTSGDCNGICVTPTAYGDYDYQYYAVDDFGCSYDTIITVHMDSGIVVNAGPDTSICVGETIVLDGSVTGGVNPPGTCDYTLNMFDGFGDTWNGFSVSVFVNGILAGTYAINNWGATTSTITFPVTDGDIISINTVGGWDDTDVSYNITDPNGTLVFNDGPSPTLGNNVWTGTAGCPLNQPAYVYLWSPAAPLSSATIPNPTATVNADITFTLTAYENGHAVCAESDDMTVFVIQIADAGLDSVLTLCWDENPVSMWSLIGGTPDIGGVWYDPNLNVTDMILDPATEASGDYSYVIGGGGACPPDTSVIAVTVIPQGDPACGCPLFPVVTFTDVSCFGACDGSLIITDAFGFEYSIDNGSTWSTDSTFTNLCAGTYQDILIRDAFPVCTDSTLVVTITEPAPLNLDFTSTNVICAGACDGSAAITASNGTLPYTYTWNGALGPDVFPGLCANTYALVVTDANGCSSETTFTITEPLALTIDSVALLHETCYLDCDGYITVAATNAALYSIDDVPTTQDNGNFGPICPGDYTVQVSDISGCVVTQDVTVIAASPIIASFDVSPQPTTISNPNITFTNTSTNAVTYLWDLAGFEAIATVDASYQFAALPATYTVCLDVWDANACPSTVCNDVIIDDELLVYVPNSFTPNSDGLNDIFRPMVRGHNESNYELMVFDRWGKQIFKSTNHDYGWDGTYLGELVQVDVYVWVIKIHRSTDNGLEEFKGHVTPIR